MNYTKEQRETMKREALPIYDNAIIKLIEDCEELIASRDSPILSAVPSEEEFQFKLEKQVYYDKFGNQYIHDDFYKGFRCCYEWIMLREKSKRGIDG